MSNQPAIGMVLSGTIESVREYFAVVNLDSDLGKGVVNISQLSDAFTPPPMGDHVSKGDKIEGLIVAIDRVTGYPELSPRKLLRLQVNDACLAGAAEVYQVLRVTDSFSLIRGRNGTGTLPNKEGIWSRYGVLLLSGLLFEGQHLALIEESDRKFRFPLYPTGLSQGAGKVTGEIVYWRLDATRKKDEMLRNILYVHIGDGYLVRCECNDVLDVSNNFAIGDRVTVTLLRERPFRGIPFGTFEEYLSAKNSISLPVLHDIVSGKVVRLLPGGAVVLVSDYCPMFLNAESTMPGKGFIGSVLHCGDFIEAEVSNVTPSSPRMKGSLTFLHLTKPSIVSKQRRDPLVDVQSTRVSGGRSGFARDSAFRMAVLEAYGFICCVCGSRFAVGTATAMEAAHIIPRGKRGTDSVLNGLCLCPLHHWAFDKGLWSLDAELRVSVAATVREDSEATWLSTYQGRDAIFVGGCRASLDALEWHRRNVLLDAVVV